MAISVASDRLTQPGAGAQLHRIGAAAAAALTAFTNALAVSLFALIPGHKIAAATAVAAGGLAFVAAALLSLYRIRQVRWAALRHALLLGPAVTFVVQLTQGRDVITQPGDSGAVNRIAVLVIVCFLIGIARAWARSAAHRLASHAKSPLWSAATPQHRRPGPRPPGALTS